MDADEQKPKSLKTSGGFTPRMNPRPKYPGLRAVLPNMLGSYVRDPIVYACVAKLLWPRYLALVRSLRMRGWSDARIFTLVMAGSHTAIYCLQNGWYALCDALDLFPKNKLRTGKPAQQPSAQLMRTTIREAALSQLVLAPLAIPRVFDFFCTRGLMPLDAPLPGFAALARGYACAIFVRQFLFYSGHRLLHYPPLYKRFHKQHHEFVETRGIASEHASPVEQAIANVGPMLGAVSLFHPHALAMSVFVTMRLIEVYEAHSARFWDNKLLRLLGLTRPAYSAGHFLHHEFHSKGNFGAPELDWAFGTADAWIALGGEEGYVKARRHKEA